MSGLTIPLDAVGIVQHHVRGFGANRLETGGFFLAPASAPTRIDRVALTGQRGILRERYRFQVSGAAFAALSRVAADDDLVVAAQFHSHEYEGELSITDRRYGFNMFGFTSVVVPHFAEPSSNAFEWAWWIYDGSAWCSTPAATSVAGSVSVFEFDEDGQHEV
jgi:proteasome lid subunit RPN8/RPN11